MYLTEINEGKKGVDESDKGNNDEDEEVVTEANGDIFNITRPKVA